MLQATFSLIPVSSYNLITRIVYSRRVSLTAFFTIFPFYCFDNIVFPGCLRLGLSWFNWWVSFAPEFQCCYFCEPSCLFYLSFNFDFYVSKIMHL